jgi:cell division septation protein DedD
MDKALKQRLVGASVLVALAVVVLPMLLSGQPDSAQESQRIELPPRPAELSFETRRFPIGDQDGSQPSVLVKPPPAQLQVTRPDAPDAQPATARAGSGDTLPQPIADGQDAGAKAADDTRVVEAAVTPPVISQSRDQAAVEPGPPTTPAPAGQGRYLVQVASFSSVGNANRLTTRLREAGMPVLLDTVDAVAGRLHRVRVGPFAERVQADQVIVDLNRQIPDLSPRVLDLRPDESAPVSNPADPLIRWVVQLGSFGESSNAEKLVYRLRDAGYRASALPVTSGTSTAYKVRVGPVIDRQDAVQLSTSIKRDLGLDGLVLSAD